MPNLEEGKTAEKPQIGLPAVFFVVFSILAHGFSRQESKNLRTEHGLERFTNILDRDRLQTVLLLHIIAHMRRNDAALKSQPRDFRQALIQMTHGAYLAGQANLADGGQIAADRQILIARRDRQNDRQI